MPRAGGTLLIGDRARAEELTQDAFVRVHPRIETLDEPAAYLRTTLVNLCRDHLRRLQTARKNPPEPPPPVTGPDVPETSTALWQALQTLPERQREAIVLRFYADLSTADIAKHLGARTATVRSLIHRGLTTLKEVVPHD